MRYSIALKDLPFEPEERQVIYVENQYDDRINALIKDNYEQIKWTFNRANLGFVYLPMFFNDEEIKDKILYYAPYLTEEIMEKVELRSSHLLGYMSHPENKPKIIPSFLFAPKKDNNEWIFEGLTISTDDSKELGSIASYFSEIAIVIEEEIVSLQPKLSLRFDEDVLESPMTTGEPPIDSSHAEYSSTPDLSNAVKRWIKKTCKECLSEEEDNTAISHEPTPPSLEEILEEDVRETLEELEKKIERLRLLGIPLDVIVAFVARYETISRLRITDDLRILLPDYGNREVLMGPLFKAIYFLFLNHPEGIVLQQLENYHHELVNYYLQTSHKKELTGRMLETINTLEYPGNNNINSILSKIKAYFRATIDEHLAKHYYIVGKPSEPYKIALDNIIIEWEEENE